MCTGTNLFIKRQKYSFYFKIQTKSMIEYMQNLLGEKWGLRLVGKISELIRIRRLVDEFRFQSSDSCLTFSWN